MMDKNDALIAPSSGLASCQERLVWAWKGVLLPVVVMLAGIILSACSRAPLLPYATNTPPLILVPATEAGVRDERGRFREFFCQSCPSATLGAASSRPFAPSSACNQRFFYTPFELP